MPGTYFTYLDLSGDGRFLAFSMIDAKTNSGDIWVLELDASNGKGAARPFLDTRWNEFGPAFSPDGGWIAYTSDETGSYEVYLRRFPGGESKKRVSNGGGLVAEQGAFGDLQVERGGR